MGAPCRRLRAGAAPSCHRPTARPTQESARGGGGGSRRGRHGGCYCGEANPIARLSLPCAGLAKVGLADHAAQPAREDKGYVGRRGAAVTSTSRSKEHLHCRPLRQYNYAWKVGSSLAAGCWMPHGHADARVGGSISHQLAAVWQVASVDGVRALCVHVCARKSQGHVKHGMRTHIPWTHKSARAAGQVAKHPVQRSVRRPSKTWQCTATAAGRWACFGLGKAAAGPAPPPHPPLCCRTGG